MNLSELLEQTARRWPDKPALIEGANVLSYVSLVELIASWASRLQREGIAPGCRVGLYYPNSANYVALTFALWRLKAVVVPIPMESAREEFKTLAATMGLEAVLSQKSLDRSTRISEDLFLVRLTAPNPPDNHGLNIAFIRFTSGTTNSRKGVVLSHETVRDRIAAANKALVIGPGDTVVWNLPMSHHFLITIVLYLSEGATIVLARQVLAREFLESVRQWQGTILYAAPFHYALLARDNSGADIPSVRLAISTTCALSQSVAEDFLSRFGRPLVQGLGIIELGLVSLNLDDPIGRWDAVGRPLPDYRVQILSPDEEGFGEVAVSGPGFFDAYASPWLSREQVLSDGWFRTGDIGRLDEDGFLFLAGRKMAVINLAGRKVFPEEVEAVLNRHPAVSGSRVFGRPHQHLGEVIEAEIVLAQPKADLEAILDFSRANLASYKIPSCLHVVSALPRTVATGKIRRAAVATAA